DSGYKVGTAGTKAVGRSSTIQLFHGSEVAFWPFADTHAAGVMQAVPNEKDTEIILESTANGIGNFFHQTWRNAEAGKNDYIAIFVPWYWSEEYRRASFETRALRALLRMRRHGARRSASMRRSTGSTMRSWPGGGRQRHAPRRRLRPVYRYDSHTRLVLERKEDMRQRGVPSPDEWD